MKRHPEIYKLTQPPVIPTVDSELEMWTAAEKIVKKLKKFNNNQMMVIIHYVMALREIPDDEMYMLHSWMLMKINNSLARQMILEREGRAAHQLVKQYESTKNINTKNNIRRNKKKAT